MPKCTIIMKKGSFCTAEARSTSTASNWIPFVKVDEKHIKIGCNLTIR